VGVLIDLSGPTSDWGKNQVKGQLDAMRWVNENGGINGKELQLVVIDDAYDPAKGVAGYNRLVDSEKSAGDLHSVHRDHHHPREKDRRRRGGHHRRLLHRQIRGPGQNPFQFLCLTLLWNHGPDRLKWIRDNWKDPSRNPKICYIFPDNTYGRDILDVCKDYAKKIGVDVGADQVVNWPTKDATVQLTNMKRDDPDFAYITSTA